MKLPHYLFILSLPVQFCLAEDPAAAAKKTEDWAAGMPEEVHAKLSDDTGTLLSQLGFDARPKSQSGRDRPPVKIWGNNFGNFDKDDSNDWVVHVSSTNFQGKAISGTLVYDKTEHGWTCIAMLPGIWPVGWGEYVEGRMGICTRESVPEDSPSTDRETYFRWDGKRYIPDRVEFSRGG